MLSKKVAVALVIAMLPAAALAQGTAGTNVQGFGQQMPQVGDYPPSGYQRNGFMPPPAFPPAGPSSFAPMPVGARPQTAANAPLPTVGQWFTAYDAIRHQAQMSPSERQRADALMSKGLSILMPGDEKAATKALLTQMVSRYQRACQQLKSLPLINQTANLHKSYYNYFATAGQLFADYVRVQDNLFVTDAATGQPLASELIQRKQMLEMLEHQCKQVDAQTRQQFGIPAYPW